MMQSTPVIRRPALILCTFVVVLASPLVAFSAETRPPASTEVSESQLEAQKDVDPDAREVLKRAADFLRAQQRFAFSADVSYEVLQDDGDMLQFGELRRYVLRRPDRLRVDSDRRGALKTCPNRATRRAVG